MTNLTPEELALCQDIAEKYSPERMRLAIRLYYAELRLLEAVKKS